MDNVMINGGVPNGMLRIITNLTSGLQRCLKAVYIKEMHFANKRGFRSGWKKAYSKCISGILLLTVGSANRLQSA
jgi:hypothetical protein